MFLRRTNLVVIVVLVAVFVALYPYLDEMGNCDHGGCPMAAQVSHGAGIGMASTCLIAVVAASPVLLGLASLLGRRFAAADSRPTELYLSPEPPPPQLS